jgi:glycosyltransferase involved in cell wall biosynthesis
VKARAPRARLLVAGWNARRMLAHLPAAADVTIEEDLASPTDFFSRVGMLAYAPGRGSGMKIKVLEAMAYGVPVVTTGEGVEGMAARDGEHCWVAEDDDTIAARIAALCEDQATRRRFRDAGRALLEERYTAAPVMARMMDVYEEVRRCA